MASQLAELLVFSVLFHVTANCFAINQLGPTGTSYAKDAEGTKCDDCDALRRLPCLFLALIDPLTNLTYFLSVSTEYHL